MRSSWEVDWGRKLDLKTRAQEMTKAAAKRPEILAKRRSGASEGETGVAILGVSADVWCTRSIGLLTCLF